MRAIFCDTTFINQEDAIRIDDRRQTVGDDESRLILEYRFNRCLDDVFGFRIDALTRFIQDIDTWIGQDGTRKGNQLLLACGESASSFTHITLVAFFQL